MSATPDFLDTLDADVPEPSNEQPSGIPEAAIESVKPASETTDRSSDTAGVLPDVVKDKIDPAKPDDKAEKVVPLRALHQERDLTKELKRQIAELQALPKLSGEDQQLLSDLKAQKAAQAAPKAVDFLEDPKGYVDKVDEKVQTALKKLEETSAAVEKTNTEAANHRNFQALQHAVAASEQAFVATTPDYYDALNHVRTVRAQQIRLMDSNVTEDQIGKAIAQEEMIAASQLLKRGGDPCKFAYDYAKTLGYAKKAAAALPVVKEVDKSAARTMGAGGGDAPSDDAMDSDDPNNEFLSAVQERFKRRR